LERALTRAGFQLVEQGDEGAGAAPDVILVTLGDLDRQQLERLFPEPNSNITPGPPRIVILTTSDPDAPAAVLALGADDALGTPVDLAELCDRLEARIRQRESAAGRVHPAAATSAEEREEAAESSRNDALDRRVHEEFERARRYSLSFSLVLLGVDELEQMRDRMGEDAAEQRRQEVGGVLRRELRLPDFIMPYGTGEFAIVLPETDQAGARQSILRIRERLAAVQSQGDPRSEQNRFSAGIVTFPHPAATETDDLFALVEAALMRGKAQSGERIGVAM
jgi:diguanylate cyclase (GGDEF)-like protein